MRNGIDDREVNGIEIMHEAELDSKASSRYTLHLVQAENLRDSTSRSVNAGD
jgi:hypothetical protein